MTATTSNKFYNFIKTLTKSEVRQFKKMLRSPFFVHRQDVGNVFDVLATYLFKGKELPNKATLFKKAFPNKEYDDLLLRGTLSDLGELLEEYLLILQMRAEKLNARLKLASIHRRRKLEKHYRKTMRQSANLLENYPYRNPAYYRELHQFQIEQMHFQTQSKRTEELNLQEIGDSMDVLYLMQKLKHACAQVGHQQVFKKGYDYGLLPLFIDRLEEKHLSIPAVAIYYYCYRFLTEQYELDYFHQFKNLLFEYEQQFTLLEQKDLYLYAINFCIRKLNTGDQDFTQEGLGFYKKGLEAGVFLENGLLSHFTFNNVVAFGIRLSEFAWVENFIHQYADKLRSEYRDAIVSFNFARLEFHRGEYGKAMLHLQNAEYKDLVNNLISKALLLKIYYEQGETEALLSHLDSFQNFIHRREVSDFHRTNYLNIIRFTRRLVLLPPDGKKELEKIKQAILEEGILSERAWLLEKVDGFYF